MYHRRGVAPRPAGAITIQHLQHVPVVHERVHVVTLPIIGAVGEVPGSPAVHQLDQIEWIWQASAAALAPTFPVAAIVAIVERRAPPTTFKVNVVFRCRSAARRSSGRDSGTVAGRAHSHDKTCADGAAAFWK